MWCKSRIYELPPPVRDSPKKPHPTQTMHLLRHDALAVVQFCNIPYKYEWVDIQTSEGTSYQLGPPKAKAKSLAFHDLNFGSTDFLGNCFVVYLVLNLQQSMMYMMGGLLF